MMKNKKPIVAYILLVALMALSTTSLATVVHDRETPPLAFEQTMPAGPWTIADEVGTDTDVRAIARTTNLYVTTKGASVGRISAGTLVEVVNPSMQGGAWARIITGDGYYYIQASALGKPPADY